MSKHLSIKEPLARRMDPVPSFVAAERHQRSGGWVRQKSAVLAALRQHPGATSAELAATIGGDRYIPSRRLPDLEREGLVKRGSDRLCKVTGQACITWWPVRIERDLFGHEIRRDP